MLQFRIGTKHTLDDWGALLSEYEIKTPEAKTNYVDLPGGDGVIDLTEALTGDVKYDQREISATFTFNQPRSQWPALHAAVTQHAHGRRFTIEAPEDPDYYYIGRINIGPLKKDGALALFELEATCEPYKYKNAVTSLNYTVGATGTLVATLANQRRRVIPTITVSAQTQIIYGASSTTVSAGTYKITDIVLEEGNNTVTFNAAQGTTITVAYQEATI